MRIQLARSLLSPGVYAPRCWHYSVDLTGPPPDDLLERVYLARVLAREAILRDVARRNAQLQRQLAAIRAKKPAKPEAVGRVPVLRFPIPAG